MSGYGDTTNPYVVRRLFNWKGLHCDHTDNILEHAGRIVVFKLHSERNLPDELRPPDMPPDHWHRYPTTSQTLQFERTRASILADGPLTVTLRDEVDRTWWGFAKFADEGWPLDPDAFCTAMALKQKWSKISKIRMPVVTVGGTPFWWFRFVQRRDDGQEDLVGDSDIFRVRRPAHKEFLTERFTEELQLTHAVVDGVDEFSC